MFHQVPSDWVLVGNGAAELLTWLGRDFAAYRQTHLLTPAFSDYHRALKSFGVDYCCHPISLPMLAEGVRLSSIQECLDQSFQQACNGIAQNKQASLHGVLLNSPHNPTGHCLSKENLLPLVDRYGLVAVDEAFMEFLTPEAEASLIKDLPHHPNLVILRSLTKFFSMPGLRLGYVLAHPDRIRRWQQWRDPWSVNALAIAAGLAALQDQVFAQRTYRWLAATRPVFLKAIAQVPGLCPFPSVANFLLVQTAVSAVQIQEFLLKQHRIFIRDCLSFKELGDRYFRVAIRTEAENQTLVAGLQSAMAALGPRPHRRVETGFHSPVKPKLKRP